MSSYRDTSTPTEPFLSARPPVTTFKVGGEEKRSFRGGFGGLFSCQMCSLKLLTVPFLTRLSERAGKSQERHFRCAGQ